MRIRRSLRHWELAAFLAVCVFGTLLRYLAARIGAAPFAVPDGSQPAGLLRQALRSVWSVLLPANGSVWEQMKALYLPYLACTLAELPRFADPYRNFFASKGAAGLAGLLAFPILCFAADGALGALPGWGAAAIFCASAAVSALSGYGLLNSFRLRGTLWQLAGCALLLAPGVLFAVFTWRPPALPLFHDSVSFFP